MKKCKVEECNNPVHNLGYCPKHYGRFMKHGNAEAICRLQHLPPEERFWMKVKKGTSEECWEWQESNRRGYGCLWVNRKYISAHRFSWILHYGHIEEGLCVLHKCDNPICVNPTHLFLGTNLDNTQDRVNKGRSANGEKTSRGKLSREDVSTIKELMKTRKVRVKLIAEKYNVSAITIYRIDKGETYAYYRL